MGRVLPVLLDASSMVIEPPSRGHPSYVDGGAGVRPCWIASSMGMGLAWQIFCHPGKFQVLGKPLHCSGLASWMRHCPLTSMLQEWSSFSRIERPFREVLILVCCAMNSSSERLRKEAIMVTSSSEIRTSPGHRQHAVHWSHW